MKHPAFLTFLLAAALCIANPSCVSEDEDGQTPNSEPDAGAQGESATKPGTAKPDPAKPDAGKSDAADAPPAKTAKKFTSKEKKLARIQFEAYCKTCHGQSGKGDGPAGLALDPKPRDWTDEKWQASVTDEHIFNIIKDGGGKHGLSPLMAPNPQYADHPGVLHALVAVVRSYRGK